jgi:hypothetical protein
VELPRDSRRRALIALRIGLVVFVVVWLLGPLELRAIVPIWLPFLIALGLEIQFFVTAYRSEAAGGRPDRGPQAADRERFGYDGEELVLVRRDGAEVWVPYSGQTADDVDALLDEEEDEEEPEFEDEPEDWAEPARSRMLPLRGLVAGLAVIAALAALVWFVEGREGWSGLDDSTKVAATDRFSAEAARIAGHPVSIRCDESGEHVGAVQHSEGVAIVGGTLAYLTPERCYDLYRLAFDGDVSSQIGHSIAVLAHEAWHLNGVANEATTQCYALQSGVDLGRRLGLSEGTARSLMRQQLAENTGRATNPEYRVSAECRDGGELDLDRSSSEFP